MRRAAFEVLSCLFLGVCAGACGDTLEPASRLSDLRLVAVAADKPAAAPGEQVSLRALYENPDGERLRWGYALCDGGTSSAALDCLRALDLATLQVAEDQPEFSFEMPAPPARSERPIALGVAVIVCPGEIVRGDTHGVPIACQVDGEALAIDAFEMGVKRIFYADEEPNRNPGIARLTFDGAAWPEDEVKTIAACPRDTDKVDDCARGLRHTFVVEAAADAIESFSDNDGREVKEQVVAQYYATGGTFEWDVRTIEDARTRFIARARDAGKTLTLHFVVRDSRGGVSWETRTIAVTR